MPRTYTRSEMETAVAISGDLHGHPLFQAFCARHRTLTGAVDRWNLCIETAALFESRATQAEVHWGETHDFYLVIAVLVDQLVTQEQLNPMAAILAALDLRSDVPG
jgi:hypothetical protein